MSKELNATVTAELLGVSRATVYRWLADGELESLEPKVVRKFLLKQVFGNVIKEIQVEENE